MSRLHVAYDDQTDSYVGATSVDTIIGTLPVFVSVPLKPLAERVAQMLVKREVKRAGVTRDEVGFFGFLKKAWNGVWDKAKKIARAVGITKVINAVKNGAKKALEFAGKVVKSPAFGTLLGVASFIPGVGPIALAGYAAVRAAMAVADGVTKGDPKALETVGKYALPGGEKSMALIRSVAPALGGAF